MTAARSEQLPLASAHVPSPGTASTLSTVVLTVNVAARTGAGESPLAIPTSRNTPTLDAA
jgi:hypothetical protein